MGNSIFYGKVFKRDQIGDLYGTKPLFIFSSETLARDPSSPLPICCNDTQSEFRAYRRSIGTNLEDERVVGMYCKNCHAEWLDANVYSTGKFQEDDKVEIRVVDSENVTVTFENSTVCNLSTTQLSTLTRKVPRDGLVTDFFEFLLMTIPQRKMIERNSLAMDNLQPGDHIMWHRPYAVWHHQLIRSKTGQYTYDVVHFDTTNDQKLGFNVEVQQKTNVDFSKEPGTLYKVNYNSSVEKENPKELVFDRANAKLHDKNYRLFTYNCEHVITFCKTGRLRSFQASWLKTELVFFLLRAIAIAVAAIIASSIDGCFCLDVGNQTDGVNKTSSAVHQTTVHKSELIEVVLVLILELLMFAFIVWRHWKVWKSKGIERLDFLRRVGEALTEVVCTIGLYYLHIPIILSLLRNFEMNHKVALFLDIVIGIALGIFGKMIGFFLGQFICQKVGKVHKIDSDEALAGGLLSHEFSSSRGYGSCSSTSDVSCA